MHRSMAKLPIELLVETLRLVYWKSALLFFYCCAVLLPIPWKRFWVYTGPHPPCYFELRKKVYLAEPFKPNENTSWKNHTMTTGNSKTNK